jgi:PAS domain S-box-containing protein
MNLDNKEQLFQSLFEKAGEGYIVIDQKGTIRLINPRIEELFEYSREELMGQKVEMLIPEKYHHSHVHHREGFHKSPKKRLMGKGSAELFGQAKSGNVFPVEIGLNHIEHEGERFSIALITDITERKKAEDQVKQLNAELEQKVEERTRDLKDSQQLYSAIARNFPKGTINVFDRDLCYVFVEGKELYVMGINSKKLVGTKYLDRLSPEIAKDIEPKLLQVFEGKSTSFEIEYKKNNYVMNAVPLQDDNGEINQILVVEKNVTEEKIAEEGMRKALQKEQQLNELKSRFVSMASHEFRTPLSSILSSTSLIARYADPSQEEKREKHIGRIKTSVGHLTNILNDFLSLDKLEEGIVEINCIDFDIKGQLKEVNEELNTILKTGQQIDYQHTGSTSVHLDRNMLKNIMNNLISNAIKYSAEGKVITLISKIDGGRLTIEVIDQGIGIPKEDQSHMFGRFFRAGNVTNIQGTGLGLNIVKKYVDLLDGEVSFKSVHGEGTTFTVNLPTKKS